MTPIKRNLLYIFRGDLLRLRITWNHGVALTLSVGYHVDKTDSRGRSSWDGSRCRKNTTHGKDKVSAAIINKALDNLEDRIEKAFFYFENMDRTPTKDELKRRLDDKKTSDSKTVVEMIDEFINEQGSINQWSLNMTRNVRKSLLYLVEALGENVSLDSIDNTQYARLLQFFYNKKVIVHNLEDDPIIQTGLKNTTINAYLNNIRRFVKWAEEKTYCSSCTIPKQPASLKTINKQVIFLEWHELMAIMNLDLQYMPSFNDVRTMFCFSCFTGLRFSDMQSLKWSDVYEDRIEVVTQKTSDRLIINFNKFSKEIIDQLFKTCHEPSDKVFKKISLNNYNHTIIKIAKMAKIDTEIEILQLSGANKQTVKMKKYECITSHTARRTFVCNSLSLGIPPNIIMKWTGHKNYKSMKPYIDVTSSATKDNMSLFDTLPSPNKHKSSENSSALS